MNWSAMMILTSVLTRVRHGAMALLVAGLSLSLQAAPTVTLTAPAGGAQYAAPATITLSATASSNDSTISWVEFYQGTTAIGSATAAPYAAVWANVPLGSYSLTAKAVDAAGIETYSAAVAVTVSAPGAKLYYLHTDQLDTPRLVTDETNTIVWRQAPLSEPFGLATPEEDPDGDGNAFTMNLRFPGQYADKETNTNYNYFRDYNPELGRYIQSDPIGLKGGINTFAYVEGNPMSRKDPKGLYEPWEFQPDYPSSTSSGAVGNASLGAGGSGAFGPLFISGDAGVAVDTKGHICVYSNLCSGAGANAPLSGTLAPIVGGVGTGELCTGSTSTKGGYWYGGAGLGGEGTVQRSDDGNLSMSRGGFGISFSPSGEAGGAGYAQCKQTLICND